MGSNGSGEDDSPPDAEPESHNDYTIDVTPSVDTPHKTVTVEGHEIDVSATGRVRPGKDLTVTVDAPPGEDYQIQLRNGDGDPGRVSNIGLTGNTTVTFDTGPTEKPALKSRGYGAIAKDDGTTVDAFYPVVVSGYAVDVTAPETIPSGGTIRASLTKLDSERSIPPIDAVTAVVWDPVTDDDDQSKMTTVADSTYETTIDRAPGDYRLEVVVEGRLESGSVEPIGISDPQPLSIVDASYGLSAAWTVDTGHRHQYARPGFDSQRLYLGGLGSQVGAYDRANDGSEDWVFDRAGSLADSSPTLHEGTVLTGSGGGTFYGVNVTDGNQEFSVDVGSAVTSSPAVMAVDGVDVAFFGANDGTVHGVDLSSASGSTTPTWSTDVGAPVYSALAAASGRVFVTTTDGDVVALDATDSGTELWRQEVAAQLGAASPVHDSGTVFVAGDALVALRASDGDPEWQLDAYTGGTGATPAVSNDSVYVGDADSLVYAVDHANDGAVDWSFRMAAPVAAQPGVAGDKLVVADLAGTVLVLDRATGDWVDGTARWTPVRSPVPIDGDTAFVATEAGTVEVYDGIS